MHSLHFDLFLSKDVICFITLHLLETLFIISNLILELLKLYVGLCLGLELVLELELELELEFDLETELEVEIELHLKAELEQFFYVNGLRPWHTNQLH